MTALHDDPALRALLDESEVEPDDDLMDALRELRSLGGEPVAPPSGELARLLALGPARRGPRLGRRGAAVITLVALATVGTGLSAAASPDVRGGAAAAIAAVAEAVAPKPVIRATPAVPASASQGPATPAVPATPSAHPHARATVAPAAPAVPVVAGDDHASNRRTDDRSGAERSDGARVTHDDGEGQQRGASGSSGRKGGSASPAPSATEGTGDGSGHGSDDGPEGGSDGASGGGQDDGGQDD